MRELVIVPTFERPALLHCALEAIREADPALPIHVFPDRGTNALDICLKFGAEQHRTIAHSHYGNSFNMLEALKWASTQSCALVHIIEDDAIVGKGYFEWARQALRANPTAFAACGWKFSPDFIPQDGPDLLIGWYLSVTATLPKSNLAPILQHARPDYYNDMRGYLDRVYPSSPYRGTKHFEQDGLVLRVMHSMGQRAVWPRRPKSTHIGFFGYHAPGNAPDLPLDRAVEVIKLALAQPTVLANLMAGGRFPEIGFCWGCGQALLVSSPSPVVCAPCFHAKRPKLAQASPFYHISTQLQESLWPTLG